MFNRCPDACGYQQTLARHVDHDDEVIRDEYLEPGESILVFNSAELVDRCYQINQVATKAQELAEQAFKEKKKKTFEEIVPAEYHEFRSVFAKESFNKLPPFRPWDHAIELKPGSEPVDCKIYPLSHDEQTQLDIFLEENLNLGCI